MPSTKKRMASTLSNLVRRGTTFLTPNASTTNLGTTNTGFTTAAQGTLFKKVDPAVDGEDCDHDCDSCTIKYPAKFKIDEDAKLYGHVKGWATHLLVGTGKTDWVRDVEDEKGSVMEAVGQCKVAPANGKLMLSASNIPLSADDKGPYEQPATCLLLPAFTLIDGVTPKAVTDLITYVVNNAPTNTSPLDPGPVPPETTSSAVGLLKAGPSEAESTASGPSELGSSESGPSGSGSSVAGTPEAKAKARTPQVSAASTIGVPSVPKSSTDIPPSLPTISTRPCPHDALILLCSQRTRDARCGQSAPLLRREFERHLRPLGLYRDLHDERPGGVGIYFISHVGGHKFSANVMVYRRAGMGRKEVLQGGNGVMMEEEGKLDDGGASKKAGAGQCIWLARVRPEDCEGIVKFTVMQGKVVKPERQLRGGFDRERGLCSW